jgi:hypothetical protein
MKCLAECTRHSLAEIPTPLWAEGQIAPEPPSHEIIVATLVSKLNGYGAMLLEFPDLGQEMLGHATMERCGPIRPEQRDEAGLGRSGFGIAGEDDEAFTNGVSARGLLRVKSLKEIGQSYHGVGGR